MSPESTVCISPRHRKLGWSRDFLCKMKNQMKLPGRGLFIEMLQILEKNYKTAIARLGTTGSREDAPDGQNFWRKRACGAHPCGDTGGTGLVRVLVLLLVRRV